MKVICPQDGLARGLALVSRAVTTRTTLPVLSNILIEADGGDRLKLSATNLELGINCWIPCRIDEPGGTTVPARLLGDFVASLPAGDVAMELVPRNQTLKVSLDRFKADIKGIDAADFPVVPTVEQGARFTLDARLLKQTIGQVVIAAASDDSRPILTGVQLTADPDAGKLTLAATDGFRLSVREAVLDAPLDGRLTVIVPARALAELQRMITDDDDRVEVAITPKRNQILFQLRDLNLISQLIEGTFPPYERTIPSDPATRAVINTKALHGAVRMASFFARDAANIVRLRLDPGDELGGTATVFAQAAEVGDNESQLEAAIEGEGVEVAFNAKYLLDVLGALGSEQVVVGLGGPSSPGLFRPADDTPFSHVIMPMHISR